jgi:hypothetical protein
MRNKIPPFISRISMLLALMGGFIGVMISFNNGDAIGWSLLRGAILFAAFGIVSRWWLGTMAKAWLESRLEAIQAKAKSAENPAAVGVRRAAN